MSAKSKPKRDFGRDKMSLQVLIDTNHINCETQEKTPTGVMSNRKKKNETQRNRNYNVYKYT